MIPHPKPAPRLKPGPKPIKRGTFKALIERAKRANDRRRARQGERLAKAKAGTPLPPRKRKPVNKYLHPAWRKLRAERLKLDSNRCALRFAGCTGEARTVHHLAYARGRGVNRLLVPLDQLRSACWECHEVADPWLGKGFGRGSRQRNAEVVRTKAASKLADIESQFMEVV